MTSFQKKKKEKLSYIYSLGFSLFKTWISDKQKTDLTDDYEVMQWVKKQIHSVEKKIQGFKWALYAGLFLRG